MTGHLADKHRHDEVEVLRRRFKAICLATNQQFQNYQIRVHRALSWYDRALDQDADTNVDGRLVFGWIVFNSLYGTWDATTGFPAKDSETWKGFLGEILAVDQDNLLGVALEKLRPEVLALLENQFLDPRFWRDPSRPGNVRKRYYEAQSLYHERRWHDLLIFVVERIYILRGQIVHGAATQGSKLNRQTLRQCALVLEKLLPIFLKLVIEHRADHRWPPLCYPPIDAPRRGNGTAQPHRAR